MGAGNALSIQKKKKSDSRTGSKGHFQSLPCSQVTQPAALPSPVLDKNGKKWINPFVPVPFVFVECFLPLPSPDINCHTGFFKPQFSRTLLLVFQGVPFSLTPSHSLDPEHRSAMAGTVGSEQLPQCVKPPRMGMAELFSW